MSAVCPAGHTSESTDYCDTCGAPIAEGALTPGAPEPAAASSPPSGNSLDLPPVPGSEPAAAASGPKPCPNCQTPNTPDSLFCEACGYDFTTGALPAGAAPTPPESPPAEPVAPTSPAEGEDLAAEAEHAEEPAASPPAEATSPEPSAAEASGPDQAPAAPTGTGVPPRIPFQWVAEVWIDPDWYADQQAEEPLPSPGLPVVVPLRIASAMIGRKSASRNIAPDIDCSADPGVSRRHAQLTTDGSRWFIEDLQSSNGTFVGPASGPLPDQPIAVGPKTEVGDNRVYVGAWTRIVVRRATDEEIAVG
ncbi:MAG: FHA domain-containing protein [Tetrasphaera sp.]